MEYTGRTKRDLVVEWWCHRVSGSMLIPGIYSYRKNVIWGERGEQKLGLTRLRCVLIAVKRFDRQPRACVEVHIFLLILILSVTDYTVEKSKYSNYHYDEQGSFAFEPYDQVASTTSRNIQEKHSFDATRVRQASS